MHSRAVNDSHNLKPYGIVVFNYETQALQVQTLRGEMLWQKQETFCGFPKRKWTKESSGT